MHVHENELNNDGNEYSIVLSRGPKYPTTINIQSSDIESCYTSQTQIIFSPNNWDIPVQVLVFAVDDLVDQGDYRQEHIIHTSASEDKDFDRLSHFVNVKIIDDDVAQVQVGSGNLTLPPLQESSPLLYNSTTALPVRLGTIPTAQVTVSLSMTPHDRLEVYEAQLVILPEIWDTGVIFQLAVVPDYMHTEDIEVFIKLRFYSEDPFYSYPAINDIIVTVLVINGDFSSVEVSYLENFMTFQTESNELIAYNVFSATLKTKPYSSVEIELFATPSDVVDLYPKTLYYTPDDWQYPQYSTVVVNRTGTPLSPFTFPFVRTYAKANTADTLYQMLPLSSTSALLYCSPGYTYTNGTGECSSCPLYLYSDTINWEPCSSCTQGYQSHDGIECTRILKEGIVKISGIDSETVLIEGGLPIPIQVVILGLPIATVTISFSGDSDLVIEPYSVEFTPGIVLIIFIILSLQAPIYLKLPPFFFFFTLILIV